MKNLFNNISIDEKNRILEMHSVKGNVISEQTTTTKGGHKGGGEVSPTLSSVNSMGVLSTSNSDNTIPKKEIKSGTAINLYSDKDENTSPTTYKISSITDKFSDGVVMEITPTATLTFKCGFISLFLKTKTKNTNGEVIIKSKNVFNNELYNDLKSMYCTKNKSGKSVPKVDYAMNNQQDTSNTGIA